MDQHLHAVAAPVGEQVSTVRASRTEDLHYLGQHSDRTGPHILGLGSQPDFVDADYASSSRIRDRQVSASEAGHSMTIGPLGCGMVERIGFAT